LVPRRSAVELTRQRAAAAGVGERLHAFVCDVTRAPLLPQARNAARRRLLHASLLKRPRYRFRRAAATR
jgi:hypothetical protein